MTLPNVTLNVLNGQLGRIPPSNANILIYLGVSAGGDVDGLDFFGSINAAETTLVYGEVLEAAAYELSVSGGPVGVLTLPPTTIGGFGAVTHTGVGAGSLAVSAAPPESIAIACTTAGALGVAKFTFQVGSRAVSQPVLSDASWGIAGYRVPGTFTTLVFTAGNYRSTATQDTYLVSTLGAVTHPTGTGPAVPTQTSSPVDWFDPKISITTGGANGAAQFTYSLDGTDANASGAILTTGGGTYAIPGTGIVLAFSGTQTAGDFFDFQTAGPRANNTDLAAAFAALETTYLSSDYSMLTVVGNLVDTAAWITQCATIGAAGSTLFNAGVYERTINGVPTIGTVTGDGTGGIVVNSTSDDTAISTARLSVQSARVATCAGDVLLTSPITGLSQRRNGSFAASAMAASVSASQSIGAVENGAMQDVTFIFRDEQITPELDNLGFITFRTFPGSVSSGTGLTGYYITNGYTMDAVVSDFHELSNGRVMDLACRITKAAALPYINARIPTTTRSGQSGVITEKKAQQIEASIGSKLNTGLVDVQPQEAVGTNVTIDRNHDIIADSTLEMTVGVQPFALSKYIFINIGLTKQA